MPATQTQINAALTTIEALLMLITPLRKSWADLQQVQLEYDEALRLVKTEAIRLEGLRRSLDAKFKRRHPSPPDDMQTIVTPPKPMLPAGSSLILPVTTEFPNTARKRVLADHIFYFTDQPSVLEVLNAIVDDNQRDVGDMLEIIPWDEDGRVWKARTVWESLDQQYERLTDWCGVLEERLIHWKAETRNLEENFYYLWLVRKQTSSVDEWQTALQEEVQKQARKNEQLAAQLRVWEQELQAHEAGYA